MRMLAHLQGAQEHELIKHLIDVADLATCFARRCKPHDERFAMLAYWSGLLHDLGKYRIEFQEYLRGIREKGTETQHSVFGAAWAWEHLSKTIALAITGHHAGIPSFSKCDERLVCPALEPAPTAERLFDQLKAEMALHKQILPSPVGEVLVRTGRQRIPVRHQDEFLTRMLFSCLVDADYLDTERFMRGRERQRAPLLAGELYERVEAYVRGLAHDGPDADIGAVRREIYSSCVDGALNDPGFFSLTAPTGGGKTLAGMAFALRHAAEHGLDRIIIVLPFLTIIEQNARVYRKVLGEDAILEHHSGAAPGVADSSESETAQQLAAKQATENWDAPIIVTTSVQFLESLFDRKPSRCRKLHNIARAVVVFDEVQALPHHLLEPILSTVRELRTSYGTSFLFCSATQPRFEKTARLPSGLTREECRELAPRPREVFRRLQRTRYELAFLEQRWDWRTLLDRIKDEPRVLVVVNLRRLASKLLSSLAAEGVEGLFHLSSTMCPEHRTDVLGDKDDPADGSIHYALRNQRPCRVVSTQVVEAGVDIDFPVVFRSLGPLDAIIQAGGRCNREGRLPADDSGRAGGRVVVFELEGERNTPPAFYEFATATTRELLASVGNDPDRLAVDPDLFPDYHETLIAWKPTDNQDIQQLRAKLDFESVAERFRLIDQAGETVVVPYRAWRSERRVPSDTPGEAERLIGAVAARGFAWPDERRRLQRFSVNLYPQEIRALSGAGAITRLTGEESPVWRLVSGYDDRLGIPLGELPVDQFACF